MSQAAVEAAHLLGLLHEQVVCREIAVGSGFGRKSKASEHEVLANTLDIDAGLTAIVGTAAALTGSMSPV